MGPTNFLMVDRGSNYVSKELKGYIEANGITIDEVSIEAAGSIGTVERNHASLRATFQKV